MDFFLGGIIQFGGTFAPKNWASCEGQLLTISENQALFAILGTTWGGDGRTTLGLPDLRGRVPVGIGRAPGLSQINLGLQFGTEINVMTIDQMPAHSHSAVFIASGGGSSIFSASATVNAFDGKGDKDNAGGNYFATGATGAGIGAQPVVGGYSSKKGSVMASDAVTVDLSGSAGGTVEIAGTGAGKAQYNIQPSLGMRHLICLEGLFPSRN